MSDWRERGHYLPPGWKEDEKRMVLVNDSGLEVACHYEVCSGCEGKGSCVNPSIDSHGIGADEWNNEWDEESRAAYCNGGYDITCPRCNGKRVEMAPNDEDPNRASLDQDFEDEANFRAEQAAERRMGA